MQPARPNRLRRAIAFAALAALLGVVALVLSQCTMVGDSLTGVGLEKNDRSNCVNACNETYSLALGQAKKDCQVEEDYDTCFAALKAIAFDVKTACIDGCHKQGGGGGG